MTKPIAIIAGEPNSISSEIIFKSWKLRKRYTHKPFIIIGSIHLLNMQKQKLKYHIPIKKIESNFEIQNLNKNELQKFYQAKQEEVKKEKEYRKHKCFLKKGFNESTCKSFSFNKKTFGVWDKPCVNNQECPFYKANKNYSNRRGGCINGYCEMPKNIKRVGYKYYDTKNKPFCHNCKNKDCLGEECFTCCEEQYDRKKYPFLKSADFVFENDNR